MAADSERKKQLKQEYAERMPTKGVFEICCHKTGERYFGIARDFKADYNGTLVRLNSGSHPNKRMQELWNAHGEEGLEIKMLEELDYDDPHADYAADLEAMRDLLLETNPAAKKVWK